MIIVNADDFGHDPAATDATLECFADGRVSSATAMVHMGDSERAARAATAAGLPVGLHLNLSEPFSSTAPFEVRQRQHQLTRRFSGAEFKVRRWLYDPFLQPQVEASLADQLSEFRRLYGRDPSHVDGHDHLHLSPNVGRARAIPPGWLSRGVVDPRPARGMLSETTRRLRNRVVLRKRRTPAHVLDIVAIEGRERVALAGAVLHPIEVMCHPGFPEELAILRSDAWLSALSGHRVGSFLDLA